MNKKKQTQVDKLLIALAFISLIVSFIEGLFFYSAAKYPHPLFRIMLIVQNSIRAFGFKSDISIKNIAEIMANDPSLIERIVGYLYAVVLFIAPYCTLKVIYKFLDKLFRFRNWGIFSSKPRIVIFGYNAEVKSLISGELKQKNYRIHIISPNFSENELRDLSRGGVIAHQADCLSLDASQQTYFFKEMEIKKASTIVLFDQSSARNFSAYKLLNESVKTAKLKEDVKVFCRCEDRSIAQVLEDYHDKENGLDLEIVSIPVLRVQSMLRRKPLHSFYDHTGVPAEEKHLHLLIVGFGKLGQELLLQAMNMGVLSSKNRILIDVIDFKMDEKQNLFANHFNENYFVMEDSQFSIPSQRADGGLTIRFHQLDIRFKRFYEQLQTLGNPEKDGIFTYIAICIKDQDIALHSLCEVQRYLQDHSAQHAVIGVQMETDKQMADYLNKNDRSYKNVFSISDCSDVISLQDLIHETLDMETKEFHKLYNSIVLCPAGKQSESKPDDWSTLPLFKRNSSRAVAQHSSIKESVFSGTSMEQLLHEGETLLHKEGTHWVYDDIDSFVDKQNNANDYPMVHELSKMEHRRWCYYMASLGWQGSQEKTKSKEELALQKKNVCMCTWDDLINTQKDTCPYDLMWMLFKFSDTSDPDDGKKTTNKSSKQ